MITNKGSVISGYLNISVQEKYKKYVVILRIIIIKLTTICQDATNCNGIEIDQV